MVDKVALKTVAYIDAPVYLQSIKELLVPLSELSPCVCNQPEHLESKRVLQNVPPMNQVCPGGGGIVHVSVGEGVGGCVVVVEMVSFTLSVGEGVGGCEVVVAMVSFTVSVGEVGRGLCDGGLHCSASTSRLPCICSSLHLE